MNSMIKRTSVASSFTTPRANKEEPHDRAASLAGLLPLRSPAPPPTIASTPPVTTTAQTVSPRIGGGGVATIGVYLAPFTLDRAREVTQGRRITYTDLLVEAFDNVTDAELAAEFVPEEPLVQGKMMPTRPRRRRGAAGIQMNLRLSREQREWLDTKVQALGAPSRSALVAGVLRLHLQPSALGKAS